MSPGALPPSGASRGTVKKKKKAEGASSSKKLGLDITAIELSEESSTGHETKVT